MQQIVFPFTVRLTPWRGLRFTWSEGLLWLLVSVCLTGIMVVIKRRRREPLDNPFALADLMIVALFGVYGFLGVLIMPGLGNPNVN